MSEFAPRSGICLVKFNNLRRTQWIPNNTKGLLQAQNQPANNNTTIQTEVRGFANFVILPLDKSFCPNCKVK